MNYRFNQEWYGEQARIVEQTEDFLVVDYGCKGRGICRLLSHSLCGDALQ